MDVGVEIGKYKVIEHIGRGGMADVWSARDQQLNRMVAIKTIAHGLAQDANPVELFKEEAQTIAQMEHPHILPIYDYGEYEGQLYIVMRYVAGGSLEDILARGPMPMSEVLRVAQAIGQALDYAHSRDIIHLDLKPPNVLLDSHSSPYLADFGLATRLDPEGKANNPGSGTLLYMAPEQLTAEIIDKRADLYSFCIMIFHMLTGALPYEASVPMAMKQLQSHEELPEIDLINTDIPAPITDILRKGTAVEPTERPLTLMDVVEEMREVLGATTAFSMGDMGFGSPEQDIFTGYDDEELFIDGIIPDHLEQDVLEAVREAGDLYLRAHHNWSGGNGRFLMGVTNFMLMNDFYIKAGNYNLQLDEQGKQLLFRGALEYDLETAHWWDQLDDAQRRWVCLHALRSGNAPARSRAMYHLETLTDASPPQIPKLVAQALQVEIDEEARIAALHVLGTRSKLVKGTAGIDVKTEYQGRLLSSISRMGVQLTPSGEWQDQIYTAEIDLLIGESALDLSMPRVADFAARTIGRMRSKLAANYISDQQKEGRKGALRALALIRDESPSLPPETGTVGRIYAWLANTFRRMFENPMGIVWRYIAALVLACIGFGYHVYDGYSQSDLLVQDRWANTIAMGLVFATIVAFTPIFAGEFSSRLKRFWPWWAHTLLGIALGVFWGAFAWWSWRWFFLKIPSIEWELVGFGGLGIALGYTFTALFALRSWFAIPLTIATIYFPIYITFQVGWNFKEIWPFNFDGALLAYWEETKIFTVALPVTILIGLGGHLTSLLGDIAFVVRLYRENQAKKYPAITIPALPSVPDVTKYAPHTLSQQEIQKIKEDMIVERHPDIATIKTEWDVNLGDVSMEEPLKTELDANFGVDGQGKRSKGIQPETQNLNISTGLKLPPRKSTAIHTELNTSQNTTDDEPEDRQTRTPRFFSAAQTSVDQPDLKTELDPGVTRSEEDAIDVRMPRFFSAAQSQSASKSVPSNQQSDDVSISEANPEVRKSHSFTASEPPNTTDDKDKEKSEVRTPRFIPGSMDTDIDTAKKVQDAVSEKDSERTTQLVNLGTGLHITPRKQIRSDERLVSDDDLDTQTEPDDIDTPNDGE